MAATASSESTDGSVLSLISKRLRAFRKKYNRIIQMEESLAQGKVLNSEQQEVLRSKSSVSTLIDEFEKLRQPLAVAVEEEINLAIQNHQLSVSTQTLNDQSQKPDQSKEESFYHSVVEDLLNLLYFASLFDVKSQSDFTSTMLTRTHERNCCLTYDTVTDEATDLLGERDLDLISMLGALLISRPADSSLSHKNALKRCIEHAKLWLSKSDQPVQSNANITYAGLREKLERIMSTEYLTTTPEMKAPVEVAAAAGNYAPFQVPVHGSVVPVSVPVPVEVEGSVSQYQETDEGIENFQGHETGNNQSDPVEELQKDREETENVDEVVTHHQQEQIRTQEEVEQNPRDAELREQHFVPRRNFQNQRGGRGGGGRRGYSNNRGGRSGGRGSGYQNGRNQYYEQSGNYYSSRNYYNNRGRGGRVGGYSYNNHGSGRQGSHVAADAGSRS